DGRVRVGSVRVEAGAYDQPQLPVRLDALAEQLHPRLQDEVAGHPLPDEVELVAGGPHVRARGAQRVLLRERVVDGGPRDLRTAHVAVAVEGAKGALVRARGTGAERDRGQEEQEGPAAAPQRVAAAQARPS